jgi:branched-chain amino acid transport system substrate-binding protein
MSRRVRWLAIVALLLLLALPGTGVGQEAPVKIGVLTPLSPPGDPAAGQLISRGAALGAAYVNAVMGGVLGESCRKPSARVTVIVEDDSGTPEKGLAGFRKLATRDRVVAVIGQFHSSVMLAVQPLAEELKIPFFSTQASAAAITSRHLLYTFRTHAIDPDRARAWLDFIQRFGFKKVAIIGENTDYGVGLIEETKRLVSAQKLPIQLDTVIFDRGTTDFTPLLLKIKAGRPDLVINVGVGTPAYLIIKQAYDIGLFPAVPMLGSYDFPIRPEFWQNLGPVGNYFAFISYYHPAMPLTDLGKWFKERYEARYKEPAVYSAFNAFGQIAIIAQAINKACSTEGPALVQALETGKYLNWNGTVTFPRGEGPYWHQASPPLLILQYTAVNQSYGDATILWPPKMRTGTLKKP